MDNNVSVLQNNNDSSVRYAGFWLRFSASFIDGLFVLFLVLLMMFIVGLPILASGNENTEPSGVFSIFTVIVTFVFPFLYEPVMHSSKYQATVGMMALNLKIVDLEHKKISFWRALGRYLATIISSLILYIGFIMIAFTEKKQGLHDMIAGTLVIRE
ncbi:MAG: RDD family protein [Alphaproteobacteria bacterium]|nr:RDD family protein [Alphaproteobacteria bacterium]